MAATAAVGRAGAGSGSDRRVVLWIGAGVLAVIVLFSLLGPHRDEQDPVPTIFNTGSAGARGAYLLLGELGYRTTEGQDALTGLDRVDAARTTLVLAEPIPPVKTLAETREAIRRFLERGGRVLATGSTGASLLPEGQTAPASQLVQSLCDALPDGVGELTQAGKVTIDAPVRWAAQGPQYHVALRCGLNDVVVRYAVGRGEAVWWASASPLENASLRDAASLRLLLLSVGPKGGVGSKEASGRDVIFDEYLHSWRESLAGLLKGLPWWWLGGQAALLALLLVLSRGRRSGPVRALAGVPRSSPVEFAESMGRLYERGRASNAATDAARAGLLEFLGSRVGLPRGVLAGVPEGVAEALAARLGGDWWHVAAHLTQAAEASHAPLPPGAALRLVRALEGDRREVLERMKPAAAGATGAGVRGFGTERRETEREESVGA